MIDTIKDILRAENVPANARVKSVCDAISARHPGRVQAFLYYGSSLRDMDNAEKMLDFYVVVDSYQKTHKNPIRAFLNMLLPPAVYYYEQLDEEGTLSTCKYSIISIEAFENRSSNKALLSLVWGRFSQPSVLLFPTSELIADRLMTARAEAVKHTANQTSPLFTEPVGATEFWARGYYESYRTELRPESSKGRSLEIVERYSQRYAKLANAIYGPSSKDGTLNLPAGNRLACRTKWGIRRICGKSMTAIRVLNSAATFDGGLDYVLRKLKNHSGVTIEPTRSQRKHPVLWAPVLAWKLYKKGAFR